MQNLKSVPKIKRIEKVTFSFPKSDENKKIYKKSKENLKKI